MEVIEDGNIMDRIPILLQRDLEYYQKHQTVLSEMICSGIVGGKQDFPKTSSFASVKIVMWLEGDFNIAFKQSSGMFADLKDSKQCDSILGKTTDPDKFVQMASKSADLLLEHLHVLAQEALDHADLPVLTATLGAAALLKNTLYCYLLHVDDMGNSDRHAILKASYKQYVAMTEAVAERVMDLHNRVLSLYILQDADGRPINDKTKNFHETGTPSVQGWWFYMNGTRKSLWDTVPPRMAQRIFSGMLNETLTILCSRYCQVITTESTTQLLINDILNILLGVVQLLPSICSTGSDLAGLDEGEQTRDVRDVHSKCNELFNCLVYRGAEVHFIHQAFKTSDDNSVINNKVQPWIMFANPKLFRQCHEKAVSNIQDLPSNIAIGLELLVLLAQPQPSWSLLVKVLMMRGCRLISSMLGNCMKHMSRENSKWPANGCWYPGAGFRRCKGFLCTADGYCVAEKVTDAGEEYARACGALTYLLVAVGSKSELKSSVCFALEMSGRDWADCLDRRQVWCNCRPSWLAAILATVGTALRYLPEVLVNAMISGASMYQTMSLCLSCFSRTLDCIPCNFFNISNEIENNIPSNIHPVGGSVFLQLLITVAYEEMLNYAKMEELKDKNANQSNSNESPNKTSSVALAIAEALCLIDEDDKHTQEFKKLIRQSENTFTLTNMFGLEDFPDFSDLLIEGNVPASKTERPSDAAVMTSRILMSSCGRDSLRVAYDHVVTHSERIMKELGMQEIADEEIPLKDVPIIYTMFHIGRAPFDQYFRGEWPMEWSKLVSTAKAWSGVEGARVHVHKRFDMRNSKGQAKNQADRKLLELHEIFKSAGDSLL